MVPCMTQCISHSLTELHLHWCQTIQNLGMVRTTHLVLFFTNGTASQHIPHLYYQYPMRSAGSKATWTAFLYDCFHKHVFGLICCVVPMRPQSSAQCMLCSAFYKQTPPSLKLCKQSCFTHIWCRGFWHVRPVKEVLYAMYKQPSPAAFWVFFS